jgi:hypothetical protein
MTPPGVIELLDRYNVSRESRQKIETYVKLLLTWQQRINLIGPATVASVWDRHIRDSLQLLPLLPKDVRTIAELGSGAGIPGLVLAMAADLQAHLYESAKPVPRPSSTMSAWRRCRPRPTSRKSSAWLRGRWLRCPCCSIMPSHFSPKEP